MQEPFIQGKTVIHYITRWSGDPTDEKPLCGSDSYWRTVAGKTHDSAGWSMNICEDCAKIHFKSHT
jgi:hypothetical protein